MSRAKALGIRVVLVLLASVVVANLLHRVVFTADPPDPATYPRAGDTFGSAAEGFKQHVVALRDGWVVLRTQVAPRAPGPPMHFHRSFAEVFTVESGKLDVELPDGTIQLGPGEQHRVEAEVPHRPYNPTDEEVIIASDKPAMPQSFAACLVQIYHFLDAAEGRMGPGLMVRLAALDPICDSTLPEIPAVVRVGTEWLIVPFARALGYNNYYPDHSLHPEGAAEGQTVPGQNPSSSITGTGVPNMRQLGLTSYKPEMAFPGYTLFAPMEGTAVYLIDMRGNVVHRWQLPYRPGEYGYLLDNGNLLFGGRTGKGPVNIGGRGGIVMEVDWEGNSVWEYEEDTLHHDHCRLDNGNTMVLGWERVPPELSRKVKGGISGTEEEEGMWSDYFREVDPQGKTVWEWHAYQHLDPDLDAICPIHRRDEWTHTNTLKVLPDGNLLTSFRLLDTVGIIDKATGEFTWKWGRGDLGHQHDPTLLDNGNILIFDNGWHTVTAPTPSSRILEIDPANNEIKWEYKTRPGWEFFSAFISGAQRLPNENTLICEGMTGRIFEVTQEGTMVWEYANPFYGYDDRFGYANRVFRAYRYGPDFPGFKGKDLNPERFSWLSNLYR